MQQYDLVYADPPWQCRKGTVSPSRTVENHCMAETIERLYPTARRIELFCRSPRPGWDAWGNQVDPTGNVPKGILPGAPAPPRSDPDLFGAPP